MRLGCRYSRSGLTVARCSERSYNRVERQWLWSLELCSTTRASKSAHIQASYPAGRHPSDWSGLGFSIRRLEVVVWGLSPDKHGPFLLSAMESNSNFIFVVVLWNNLWCTGCATACWGFVKGFPERSTWNRLAMFVLPFIPVFVFIILFILTRTPNSPWC